ncbi:hypothetical protein BpHYR1_005106 [Brachionus plicatilis]|uniref:SWIM-type domain-containing protein n=1 Tax=Brachionus plicatilis TaxID=10195 RepID=A0A3M7R5D4_BRAPC|nr:hypothetical protein BpHYR1_005106 [Brachionus plicatilis]
MKPASQAKNMESFYEEEDSNSESMLSCENDSVVDGDSFDESCSDEKVENYFHNNKYQTIAKNNNEVSCVLCKNKDDNHKMRQIYRSCKCTSVECMLKYRVDMCYKCDLASISQKGAHEGEYKNAADFYNYVKKSWLEGNFNKRCVFHSAPGYAKTNNPIESFNSSIKRDFFVRKRFGLISVFQKLNALCKYYSQENIQFSNKIQISEPILTTASNYTIENFKRASGAKKLSFSHKKHQFSIDLTHLHCNCPRFFKKRVCPHLVAAIKLFNVNCDLFSNMEKIDRFVFKKKRGRGRPANARQALHMD